MAWTYSTFIENHLLFREAEWERPSGTPMGLI
jgi:hypothetical protein